MWYGKHGPPIVLTKWHSLVVSLRAWDEEDENDNRLRNDRKGKLRIINRLYQTLVVHCLMRDGYASVP